MGRDEGSLRISASITGASRPAWAATGASSLMMADIVVMAPPRCSYGPRPSTAANSVAPSDQRSDAGVASLRPGGTVLAVHWRHPVADYPRSGDDVHRVLAARRDLALRVGHTEADFHAGVYQRAGHRLVSVAEAEGLA